MFIIIRKKLQLSGGLDMSNNKIFYIKKNNFLFKFIFFVLIINFICNNFSIKWKFVFFVKC